MKRIWRDALSAVTPYEAGKSLEALETELGLPSVRRLSANENPLGPSPKVVEALRREAARAHLYPDAGSTELREAIAKHAGELPVRTVTPPLPQAQGDPGVVVGARRNWRGRHRLRGWRRRGLP